MGAMVFDGDFEMMKIGVEAKGDLVIGLGYWMDWGEWWAVE
jgi:hypothetical protein